MSRVEQRINLCAKKIRIFSIESLGCNLEARRELCGFAACCFNARQFCCAQYF